VNSTNATGTLIRIDGPVQPYVITESTNQAQWTPIFTNSQIGSVAVSAGTSLGSADALSTFLNASQPTLLNSTANGLRSFCLGGSLAVGTWLQLNVIKTNGVSLAVSVTNQSSSAALYDLAQQLAAAVNSTPGLQSADGLDVEDVSAGAFGTSSFNLRALGSGWNAAAIGAQLTASAGVNLSPSTRHRRRKPVGRYDSVRYHETRGWVP
jgi:hypothetical protein